MFSRLILILLSATMVGFVLTGCGAVTDQAPAQESSNQAAAPTNTSTPVATEPTTALPTAAPATEEPTVAAPAATTEPITMATNEAVTAPEAVEPNLATRTFQIVADQSEASYQVSEEFFNRPVGLITAVGRTSAIEGQFQLNISGNQVQLTENQFKVDLRTLTSDEARRDQRIRDQWLESNTYPWAEFKATGIENFPAEVAAGQDVSFKLMGDMTVREITKPQTFDVTARLDDDTFTGSAVTNLLMQDYGFEPPSILGILSVTDGVTVTVNFVAREVASTEASASEQNALAEAPTTAEATDTNAETNQPEEAVATAKLNLNTASGDEFLNTIPGLGQRMVREFEEYRPYVSIQQFRKEIGKYVDQTQVAEYEKYVYVPIDANESDALTLQQIPGLDAAEAEQLIAGRPYTSPDTFFTQLTQYVSAAELSVAKNYLSNS